jgi:fructose-1-phosphate kinase PfkB-like protein
MVAALAAARLDGLDPVESLRRAVGWSACAVLAPTAGEVDPDVAAAMAERVRVEETA